MAVTGQVGGHEMAVTHFGGGDVVVFFAACHTCQVMVTGPASRATARQEITTHVSEEAA